MFAGAAALFTWMLSFAIFVLLAVALAAWAGPHIFQQATHALNQKVTYPSRRSDGVFASLLDRRIVICACFAAGQVCGGP